ncbi:DNA pilot protein [Chicken microvirus mg8_45]|nr:DNA pilot protein [Chicken microvirus mg8_45]
MSILAGIYGGVKAAGGLLSGLFSGIGANKRLEKAQEFEREQNEISRNWQEKMYQQQVQNQRQDVAQLQAYNSPLAQMKRLQAAGLNPDLMYAGGASGLVGSSMPSYSAPSGSGATANAVSAFGSLPTVGEGMIQGIAAMKTLAETENIKQDTMKKQGEVTSLDLDNFIKAATQGETIELTGLQVTLAKKAAALSDQQRTNMIQELKNLQSQNEYCNAQIQTAMAQARNLDSSTLVNRISAFLAGPRFENECRQLQQSLKESDARINLSNAQAKEILCLVMAKKLNLEEDTLLKRAGVRKTNFEAANAIRQGNLLNIQGKQMQFNYEQSTSYDDAERVTNMVGSVLGSVGQIAADILLFKGINSGRQVVRGFGR